MKKFYALFLILLLFAGTFTVFAGTVEEEAFNDLVATLVGTMEDDFSLLLRGLGSDIDPVLMQNALAGQNMGMAELGSEKFNHFYFSLVPSFSVTAANGVFGFTDTEAYENSLVLKSMLDNFLFEGPDGLLYEFKSKNPELAEFILEQVSPIPSLKLNAGGKLPCDLELLVHGMWAPQFLTSGLMGFVPDKVKSTLPEITFNYLNIGAEVRYVLLRDSEQTPGMSVGLGGAYNNFAIGLDLGEMLTKSMGSLLGTIPDGMTNPFTEAGMELNSNVIMFGVDTAISKKFAVFYPFVKLGAWYSITNFGGKVILIDADGDGVEDEGDSIIEDGAGHNDLDMLLSTGFDTRLGPFASNMTIDYNLGSGVWGLNLGSRLQF